jgi:catechol 2,3-dioxygenase-like lactoylglutathione lyase family enzyme
MLQWPNHIASARLEGKMQKLASATIVVRDYEEAIRYFVDQLGFILLEDTLLGEGKRWVLVTPSESSASFVLAKAVSQEQELHIGNQTGGRVSFFLRTDQFWVDYKRMLSKGIEFMEEPRQEDYGTVVVFKDLYGNKWDLIETTKQAE